MKGLKTFSLDFEVIRCLQNEKNQSQIINGLLRNYFNLNTIFNEPKKEEIKDIDAELQEAGI